MLARSFMIESSSKLLITRTGIKAQSSSILGRIRPLILRVTCPWVTKSSHFRTWIYLKPIGQSWSNFMRSIIGVGERLRTVWGQIRSKLGFHGNRNPPLTYNGENDVCTFFRLFLIRSFLYLQVMRACIKSRTSSNFGQIGLTTELAALEILKIFHRLIMGKLCLYASSFIFDRIIIKVAGNQVRLKSSDEFDFGPLVSMAHLYVFWNGIWLWHIGLRWTIVAL